MLRSFLSLLVTVMLSFTPVSLAQQQKTTTATQPTQDTARCPTGCTGGGPTGFPAPPPSLSTGVFQVAQQKSEVVENEAVTSPSQIQATDVAAMATAVQSAFANMNDTGWTAKLQTWILNNTALFTSPNPSQAQMTSAYDTLVSQGGIKETLAQFEAGILSLPTADRTLFVNQVQSGGLTSVHTLIVQAMNEFAAQVQSIQAHHGLMNASFLNNPWWGIGAEYLAIVGVAMAVVASAPAVVIGIGVAGAAMGMVAVVDDLD